MRSDGLLSSDCDERLATWTPPVQPVSHPCEHKSLAGGPGLETGVTFLSKFTDKFLPAVGVFRRNCLMQGLSGVENRQK
jgi:hypothetical protein